MVRQRNEEIALHPSDTCVDAISFDGSFEHSGGSVIYHWRKGRDQGGITDLFDSNPSASVNPTVTWINHKDPEKRHVAIHCGRNHLVSNPLQPVLFPNVPERAAPEPALMPGKRTGL